MIGGIGTCIRTHISGFVLSDRSLKLGMLFSKWACLRQA